MAAPRRLSWRPPRGRVLVLAPHPDDETLGCGGAIIRHRRRGDRVLVVFVTDGGPLAAERRREARAAARTLGAPRLRFWDYPDGGLDRARDLAPRLAALLRREKPNVVYRPGAEDPHSDHRALALAFESLGPAGFHDCRYEVWAAPKPNAVLDVTRDFARKTRALRAHRTQLARVDFETRLRRRAAALALLLPGARYAEGYRVSAP